MELTGGCLCGATRYALTSSPYDLSNCHCIDCQRASGAPFVTWGSVPATDLRILAGGLRKVPHAGRVRTFASCCGTPLFFEDKIDATELDVAIATLDAPNQFPPTKNIWTEDRLPWVPLDPSLASFSKSSREGS
jgi:hypothetical protein